MCHIPHASNRKGRGVTVCMEASVGSPMVPEPPEKDAEHLSLKGQERIRTGDRIHHSAEEHALGTLPKEHGCERGASPTLLYGLTSLSQHDAESTYSFLHLSNSCPALFSDPEPVPPPTPRSQPRLPQHPLKHPELAVWLRTS